MSGVMQSEYLCQEEVAFSWWKDVKDLGLSVRRIINGKTLPLEPEANEQRKETLWEVFSDLAPCIFVTVVATPSKTDEIQTWKIEMHWCLDLGKPDREGSKRIALVVEDVLFKLGAKAFYKPVRGAIK